MRARARRSGFTLIELVVVMAIIGVIGIAVVPAFLRQAEASDNDIASPIADVLRGAQRMAADSGRVVRLAIDPASGRYQVRMVGSDTPTVRGTIDYRSGTDVRSDSTQARFRFDPRGLAWGDSLLVSGRGRTVMVGVDPWTGNVSIHD